MAMLGPCEMCGEEGAYEVCDVNASGPWVTVCGVQCEDKVMQHADDCDCTDCTLPRLGETDSAECLDRGLVCSIDPQTGRCTECDGQEEG